MSLPGRWQMIRAEHDGQTAPALVVQRTELLLTATHYTVHFADQIADRGTIEFSASPPSAPPTFTLRGDSGPNAGRSIPCIYQLVGDRLRICFGLDGTLPTAFATAAHQHRYLATYRRI